MAGRARKCLMITVESMNQDCEQDDIASVDVEKAMGIWSRATVFVTKRPAGVETLTFLFGKRDSAELPLTRALEAIYIDM